MLSMKSICSVLAVVAGVSSAQAATLVGTQREATGINNLIVDGQSYNVVFDTSPLDTVYPGATPAFLSFNMAYDAVAAIENFFNSNSVTGIVDMPTYEFNVPFAKFAATDTYGVWESFNGGHDIGGWSDPRLGFPGGDTNYGHNSVAVFAVSAVPLPSSAPMFGAALLAIGAVGYGVKRKKAAAAA